MSAIERRSRRWIRSSRSSKTQFSRCPSTRPTLLLPAPMKPTRKTAFTGEGARFLPPGCARVRTLRPERFLGRSGFCFWLFVRAFSEVNFTTETAQDYGRGDSRAPHGTPEGTSLLQDER